MKGARAKTAALKQSVSKMESESLSRAPEPSVCTVAGVSCDGQSKPSFAKASEPGTLTINMTRSLMIRLVPDIPHSDIHGASVQGLQGNRL